jgi:integrase
MTIEKRGKNRWRFKIMYKCELFKKPFEGNKTAAKQAHEEFAVQIRKGLVMGSSMTLTVFVEFFKESRYPSLSPKTRYNYDNQLNLRILPALGRFKIDEIGTLRLKRYYAALAEEGIGERTIKMSHQILSSLFTEALHLGYLSDNPCKRIPAPKYRKGKKDNYLQADEATELLEALETEPLHDAIIAYIALFTGARIGEICALTWNDVNMDNREITINKSRLRVMGEGVIDKETKTEGF